MDEQARQQIVLILEHEVERAFREAHDVNQSTLAYHSAKGMLQSGGTIKRAIKACSEIAHRVLDDLLTSVAQVEKSEEAFALLRRGFEDLLARLEAEELFYIARIASGRGAQTPDQSAWEAAQREFATHKGELSRRLDIASFGFKSAESIDQVGESSPPPEKKPTPNKGGKPLARHWDSMWAAIAVKLWNGDLEPKTQADVKAAMFDWFNSAGIDIGDTAVTQRARELWQAMQDAED